MVYADRLEIVRHAQRINAALETRGSGLRLDISRVNGMVETALSPANIVRQIDRTLRRTANTLEANKCFDDTDSRVQRALRRVQDLNGGLIEGLMRPRTHGTPQWTYSH